MGEGKASPPLRQGGLLAGIYPNILPQNIWFCSWRKCLTLAPPSSNPIAFLLPTRLCAPPSKMALLDLIMILVIEDHALTQDFHWIEINQPDWLVARCTHMLCLMVDDFPIGQ